MCGGFQNISQTKKRWENIQKSIIPMTNQKEDNCEEGIQSHIHTKDPYCKEKDRIVPELELMKKPMMMRQDHNLKHSQHRDEKQTKEHRVIRIEQMNLTQAESYMRCLDKKIQYCSLRCMDLEDKFEGLESMMMDGYYDCNPWGGSCPYNLYIDLCFHHDLSVYPYIPDLLFLDHFFRIYLFHFFHFFRIFNFSNFSRFSHFCRFFYRFYRPYHFYQIYHTCKIHDVCLGSSHRPIFQFQPIHEHTCNPLMLCGILRFQMGCKVQFFQNQEVLQFLFHYGRNCKSCPSCIDPTFFLLLLFKQADKAQSQSMIHLFVLIFLGDRPHLYLYTIFFNNFVVSHIVIVCKKDFHVFYLFAFFLYFCFVMIDDWNPIFLFIFFWHFIFNVGSD